MGLQSVWPRQGGDGGGEVGRGLPETSGNQEISSGINMRIRLSDVISHSICLSGALWLCSASEALSLSDPARLSSWSCVLGNRIISLGFGTGYKCSGVG